MVTNTNPAGHIMIETNPCSKNIDQIVKDSRIAGRIAIARILSNSLYNAKNAHLIYKKSKMYLKLKIKLDEFLLMPPSVCLYFVRQTAAHQKQSP
jgi:hypothetical protein